MLQLLSEDSILILLIMNKQRIKSNSRRIYFGIIINPKVDVVAKIDWKSLDKKSVIEKLTTNEIITIFNSYFHNKILFLYIRSRTCPLPQYALLLLVMV